MENNRNIEKKELEENATTVENRMNVEFDKIIEKINEIKKEKLKKLRKIRKEKENMLEKQLSKLNKLFQDYQKVWFWHF